MTPYRLLVTGSRHATDRAEVWWWLGGILQEPRADGRPIVVVHGDCPEGVDRFAHEWAIELDGVTPEPHPAARFGRWPACGPIRNTHMVSLGADQCLALVAPGSKGTWDCARKASDAGIPVELRSLLHIRTEQP